MPGSMPPPASFRQRRRKFSWPAFAILFAIFAVLFHEGGLPPGPFGGGGYVTRLPDLSRPGHYKFLQTQPGSDQPVAYDSCRTLHIALNPAGGPSNSGDLLLQAIAKIHRASGLSIVFDGLSTARPVWDNSNVSPVPGPAPPVLVAFADAEEVPALAGNVAGVGGSATIVMANGVKRYFTGQISLDKESFANLRGRRGGNLEGRAIMMHELGHVLGLAHVEDPNELMARHNGNLVAYGPGDLKGLKILGHGRCF